MIITNATAIPGSLELEEELLSSLINPFDLDPGQIYT